VYRSGYIPWLLGIALFIAGLGWMIVGLGPYVLPNANLDFTFITAFGEVFFTLWLWIRGWKVQEPTVISQVDPITDVSCALPRRWEE
jgi:hypothetical protein